MHKVFEQIEIQELDSVYVQLKTSERILPGGEFEPGSDLFVDDVLDPTKDTLGEVNEFIWQKENEKDVMLLTGFSGSGKSRAAKKIEEFLWKLKLKGQSKWIPIFVSLPTLKNPKFNLFEQALESENYQFDQQQARQFKQAIQEKQERIVLILDSYDEMKADCISKNLIQTNKIIQDLSIDKNDRQVKFIISTRREILTTEGYEKWFYAESLNTFKEVQLLNFDEQQKQDYLIQYSELSVKRIIKALYEFLKTVKNQSFDPQEFKSIWQQLQNQIVHFQVKFSQQHNQDFIFLDQQNQINKLIHEIKTIKIFKNLSKQQLIELKKDLESLWNVNKFMKTIATAQLENLLTTPFMLEIVVQVLPRMIRNYQGSTLIREIFKQNYKKIIEIEKLSQNQLMKFSVTDIEDSKGKKVNNDQKSKGTFLHIDVIINSLDSYGFFQKYSLDSDVKNIGNQLIVDSNKFEIQPECIDIIIRALKMQNQTAFEFYENFINYYHDQQIQKLSDLGLIANQQSFTLDVHQYSLSLALDMTIRDLSQIECQEKGKFILQSNYEVSQDADNWLDQYLGSSNSDYDYKKLIKSSTLLSAKGSTYSFTHKSIQEFYVAYYIFNFLNTVDLKNKEQELQVCLFNQEQFNISTESFIGPCKFIIEKLKKIENMPSKLIDIVLLSREQGYIRASSNSIYLLSLLQVYLGEKDFNSLQLMNTNISKLCFVNSNLSQSLFRNVQIDQCNFNNCNLSGVDWQDIKCQEQPSIDIQEQFLQFQFTPDGKYIISVSLSGKIEIRNSKNFQWEKDIYQNKYFILNENKNSYLIIGRQNSFISEIKMVELEKTDYGHQFKENYKKISVMGEIVYKLSPDCSILVYARDEDLFFSIIDYGYSRTLKKCNQQVSTILFCKNGSYFICLSYKQLYIFKRVEKKGSIDFKEISTNINVNFFFQYYFLESQTLYLIKQQKSIVIINIKGEKVDYDVKPFQLEKYEKEQNYNQNSLQENEEQEDLNSLLYKGWCSIHLILKQENQQQQQFFILLSTNQYIYFNNPEQKKLCKINQKYKIRQILIFPNYSLSNIQFILATENDKIIIYKISHKDKDFKQLLERQLYIEKICIQNAHPLGKKYILSNDCKTLFLQYGNHLWWYSIIDDQKNGIEMVAQSIISINSLINLDYYRLYFIDLNHFFVIILGKYYFVYKQIQFSEILYQTYIEIYKDSIISQSEDEQVTLISNKSKNSIIYFHHKNLDLQLIEQKGLYAVEAIDQTTFINISNQNEKFKITLCKLKKNDSKIIIDSQNIKLLGEYCLYYKYFQKLNLLVIQDSNNFLQIINMKNLQPIEKIIENEKNLNCSISPDSQVLAYESQQKIKFWNINYSQRITQIPQGHQKEVSAITFSIDGLLIASGSIDGTIILWDNKNLQYLVQYQEHKAPIIKLLFYLRNFNQILVSCCKQNIVKIWNMQYPYQEKVSSRTISSIYPIRTISISENSISLTYQDYLFLYCYNLEEKESGKKKQAINIQTGFQTSCLSRDNHIFYQKNKSINIVNLQSSKEVYLENISVKNCTQMMVSSDNQYLITLSVDKVKHETISKINILKRDSKQKWNLINEVFQFCEIQNLKISPDSKILAFQDSKNIHLYNFAVIQKSIYQFENDLDYYHIYSITDDFRYVIIFKEGRFIIKLKNRENEESNFKIFSYKNPQKKKQQYELIDPKISKNQKYIAAFVVGKKIIVFWEVSNPQNQKLIPLLNKEGKNLYEFSFCNHQDQIVLVNLNYKEELISIQTYNLNLQKFDDKIRQIKSQISYAHYCFSQMLEYFCILNIYENSRQQYCLLNLHGYRNDELNQKIQITNDVDNPDFSMAFSKDDTVFALRIHYYLYGYKNQQNNFQLFLKIIIPQVSIIRILRDNTRILIKGENQIMMLKIDVNDLQIIQEDPGCQIFMRQLVLLRCLPFCDPDELTQFTIHNHEDKILFFNNKSEGKIRIFDLCEQLHHFNSPTQSLLEFYFSQNGFYFALLQEFNQNYLLKIFKLQNNLQLKEEPILEKEIQYSSIQFLDIETETILNTEEGIIIKEQINQCYTILFRILKNMILNLMLIQKNFKQREKSAQYNQRVFVKYSKQTKSNSLQNFIKYHILMEISQTKITLN